MLRVINGELCNRLPVRQPSTAWCSGTLAGPPFCSGKHKHIHYINTLLKGGVQLIRPPRKYGGPALGPMLKSLHSGPRGGGGVPPQGPPPGSAIYCITLYAPYNLYVEGWKFGLDINNMYIEPQLDVYVILSSSKKVILCY